MSNLLAIDTSMSGCAVAVYNAGTQKTHSQSEEMLRGQAETLIPIIENVLDGSELKFSDLGGIVTTLGPGSFTGLRVGLSTAKSLALALDVPIYGCNTLQVLAYAHQSACFVITETKREDFYCQRFGEGGKTQGKPQSLSGKDLEAFVDDNELTIITDTEDRFREAVYIDERSFEQVIMPDPKAMIGMMQERKYVSEDIEPIYLRGADVSQPKNPPRVLKQ